MADVWLENVWVDGVWKEGVWVDETDIDRLIAGGKSGAIIRNQKIQRIIDLDEDTTPIDFNNVFFEVRVDWFNDDEEPIKKKLTYKNTEYRNVSATLNEHESTI